MKKALAILICLTLVLGMVACSSSKETTAKEPEPATQTSPEPAAEPTPEPEPSLPPSVTKQL